MAQTNRPEYQCYKTKEKVVIDGKLNETCWKNAMEVSLQDMVDVNTKAKMVWDDDYLYVGFECEDPDIWARMGYRDSEVPEELVFRMTNPKKEKVMPEWYRFEAEIMHLDYWVQTIAWYFPRDIMEITRDTEFIMANEKKYHPEVTAVAMIGYYNRPDSYPMKSADRVELELKTILEHGCNNVFVYSLNDVLRTPEIREVFKKYFKR